MLPFANEKYRFESKRICQWVALTIVRAIVLDFRGDCRRQNGAQWIEHFIHRLVYIRTE